MKIFKGIIKFITKWNELLTIPLALILWYFSPQILRWFDPTAATYDYGVFQIVLFTIIQFFIYTGITWVYLKITFPKVYKYLDDVMTAKFGINDTNEKNNLSQWERSKVVLWLFSLLLLSMVFLARVI